MLQALLLLIKQERRVEVTPLRYGAGSTAPRFGHAAAMEPVRAPQ
jgi:hypothetical protein